MNDFSTEERKFNFSVKYCKFGWLSLKSSKINKEKGNISKKKWNYKVLKAYSYSENLSKQKRKE